MQRLRLLTFAVVALPFVDLLLVWRISKLIGPEATALWTVVSLALGLVLVSRSRRMLPRGAPWAGQTRKPAGTIPRGTGNPVVCLAAGVLLAWPGALTDLLALAILLPWARTALTLWLLSVFLELPFRSLISNFSKTYDGETPETEPSPGRRGPGRDTSRETPIRDAEFEVLKEDKPSGQRP